jgi:hypothetical protein
MEERRVSLAAGRRDGLLRFDAGDIAGGRLRVSVGGGRVELGRAPGQQVRVRWTLPALLPKRWQARLGGRRGPRVRQDASGLHLEARRARLRIDVPDVVDVTVDIGRGDITSWGAGCSLTLTAGGQVSGRELTSSRLRVTGRYVNLHFAAVPDDLVVTAPDSLLAMPPGRYAVAAPAGSKIEVEQEPSAPSRIEVSGGPTRILVSKPPLDLRRELPEQTPEGG